MPAVKIPSDIRASNLKIFCLFGETSGNRADSSGNGNTLTDNNTVTSREGFKQARSAYFNSGSSEYLSRSNALQTGLGITGSLTASVRFKADSFASAMTILSKGGTGGNGYAVMINSATSLAFYINGAATSFTIPYTLNTFQFYDYTVVFDSAADTVKHYIDGILVGTSTGVTATIASNSNSFNVGASEVPNVYFNGQMEYLAVWDTTLTSAEIASMSGIYDIFGMDTGGEEHLRSSASLNVKMAQSFNPRVTGYFDTVIMRGYRNNSPTGNMWITIETDSAGAPSGTAVATSELIDVSILHTSANDIPFRFLTAPQLTGGTTYWIVVQGTYSVSSTVGVRFIRSSGGAGNYTGGAAITYNGSAWAAISTDDFNFRMNRIVGPLIVSHFMESGTDDGGEFFSNGNISDYAQNIKFTTAKRIKGVSLWMQLYGNPSGTLTASIYTNNAGVPGTIVGSATMAYNRNIGYKTATPSTRANGGYWYLEFATPVSLAANTEYFLVFTASAGGSGSDYNQIRFTTGSGYTSTYDAQKRITGSWSTLAAGYDMQFGLYEEITQNTGNFFPFLSAA